MSSPSSMSTFPSSLWSTPRPSWPECETRAATSSSPFWRRGGSSMSADQNRRLAFRWLATAKQDLETARWLRGGEYFNTACFQAQQAAEKALKAFLFWQGERGVRGHATFELLNRCVEFRPEFETLRQHCRVLDRHYIPTRYPDALPDNTPYEAFGPEDADDAIRRAEVILQAVQEAMAEKSDA
nr:DNA-binding protein [Bacillota bacterium]